MSRRMELDGLRGIAILLVLGYHYFPSIFPLGYLGVTLFFCVSGFVILSGIQTRSKRDAFNVMQFLARRAHRLLPLHLLTVGLCLITGWLISYPNEYIKLSLHSLASIFFVQNHMLIMEAGYFDNSSLTKPLLHFWSLSVEWQFYLGLSVLLFCCNILKTSLKASVIVILFVTSSLTYIAILRHDVNQAYLLSLTRFWEILAGALASYKVLNCNTALI